MTHFESAPLPSTVRRIAATAALALLGALLWACQGPRADTCSDGLRCPSGTFCVGLDLCAVDGCGDGYLDIAAGELCDDGNNRSGDGCRADCRSDETCGNGAVDVDVGELCDDGNTLSGDQCSADCQTPVLCGDGEVQVEGGEVCDDGNTEGGDGCSADCYSNETCGNGVIDAALGEVCDDGDQVDENDCSNQCRVRAHLAAGRYHTCATYGPARTLRCWGQGSYGQLGYGDTATIGDDELASAAGDVSVSEVVQVVAGEYHTCALLAGGAVRCWGRGSYGQLGYGSTASITQPAADVQVGGTVIQLAAGAYHTCALLDTGAVRCWGYGGNGQLGYDDWENIGDNELPSTAGDVSTGGTVIQVATGAQHTCALLDTGVVRCWGANQSGQLGLGRITYRDSGEVLIGAPALHIAAGRNHTCAVLADGDVRCWGANESGQLGLPGRGTVGDDEVPLDVDAVDLGGRAVQVVAGASSDHTCALLDNGAVRCWGANQYGQLGHGNIRSVSLEQTPAELGDVNVGQGATRQLALGQNHTCARLDSGAVRCWGQGGNGQLGHGSMAGIGDDEAPADAGDVPFH